MTPKFLKLLFIGGIFLLPFVFWPFYTIPYEIPKVVFFNRWIEILGFSCILFFVLKRIKTNSPDALLTLLITCFFLVAILTSLFGSDFAKSFWGNFYRADGLFTLAHILSLPLLASLFWQRDWTKHFLQAQAFSSLLVSILYIVTLGKDGLTFGNSNFLAGYLLVSLPFVANMSPVLLFIQIVAIFLSKAFIPISLAILFVLFWYCVKKKTGLRFYLLVGIVLAVGVGKITMSELSKLKLQDNYIAEGRGRILYKGLLAFSEKPLVGWGWANFDKAFDSTVWPIKFEQDVYVDKAHSTFLEILVTTGVFGLLGYLAINLRVIYLLLKRGLINNIFLFTVILFIIHSQTNVISIGEEAIFWFTVGLSGNKY